MAYLDIGKALKEYSAKAMFQIFKLIETSVNNINEGNFRQTIRGDSILTQRSISMNKLAWLEYVIPLAMPAPNYQMSSVTPANVGGYFPWHPLKFPGGQWFLEADIAISDGLGVVTCQLVSGSVLKAVTTNQVNLQRIRSATAIVMPTEAANIWVQVFSSSASYTATLGGAKLIFVPY